LTLSFALVTASTSCHQGSPQHVEQD